MNSRLNPQSAKFGIFEADVKAGELRKRGVRLRIARQPFLILWTLLERPGELVTREELRRRVWPQNHFTDFDHGLNKGINVLRELLGDDKENPRFIETLPGKGYRFLVPVQLGELGEEIELSPGAENVDDTPLLKISPAEALPQTSPPLRRIILLILAFALGLASGWRFTVHRGTSPRRLHFAASFPIATDLLLLTEGDVAGGPVISPDGSAVVFVGAKGKNLPSLWIQQLDSDIARPLLNTPNPSFPFWSPDSHSIAFFGDRKLKVLDLRSGIVRVLSDAPSARGGSWGSQDTILFSPDTHSAILEVGAAGGPARPLILLDNNYSTYRWPEFLPDGVHFLFVAANHDAHNPNRSAVFLSDRETKTARRLLYADSNALYANGSLLFASGNRLFRQTFDLRDFELREPPRIVAENVEFDPGSWHATFSAISSLLVYRKTATENQTSIEWRDRSGRIVTRITGQVPFREVSIVGNQELIATGGDPDRELWRIQGSKPAVQLTHRPLCEAPVTSPNARRVAFGMNFGSEHSIAVRSIEGIESEEILLKNISTQPTSWSRDGADLFFIQDDSTHPNAIRWLDFNDRKTYTYLAGRGEYFDAVLSPDGKWLAIVSNESGSAEVYVSTFPEHDQSYRVSPDGGGLPRWRRDGKELFYLTTDGRIQSVRVGHSTSGIEFSQPTTLFSTNADIPTWATKAYDVDSDGQMFAIVTRDPSRDSAVKLVADW